MSYQLQKDFLFRLRFHVTTSHTACTTTTTTHHQLTVTLTFLVSTNLPICHSPQLPSISSRCLTYYDGFGKHSFLFLSLDSLFQHFFRNSILEGIRKVPWSRYLHFKLLRFTKSHLWKAKFIKETKMTQAPFVKETKTGDLSLSRD